jgi:hypothetical protein
MARMSSELARNIFIVLKEIKKKNLPDFNA